MLNWIFLLLIGGAVATGAWTDRMKDVSDAGLASAKSAVDLAIGLIGQMAMWLGFMAILKEAGVVRAIGRGLKPVMTRLFPDVPPDHPAMGAMIMNLAANMSGLTNAATPFGLKAMQELDKLNKQRGTATNAMALFLAINTAGVAVLPLGVIAVRTTLHSHDPAGIVLPSILATSVTTIVGILAAKFFQRLPIFSVERVATPELPAMKTDPTAESTEAKEEPSTLRAPDSQWRAMLAAVFAMLIGSGLFIHLLGMKTDRRGFPFLTDTAMTPGIPLLRNTLSEWLLPLLMAGIVLYGFGSRVKVYEAFIGGAKESLQVAVLIVPYLVAILVAVGMFRASGGLDALIGLLSPITSRIGIPAEVLPMALIKPLSGSGALGVMTDTMTTYGPDSLIGYIVSVMNGSTETTFYVLAVYFGSVQVKSIRHTLAACLVADTMGLASAVYLSRLFFRP